MALNRAEQNWPDGELFQVIERGRTTGYIYQVSNPLLFHVAEAFVYELRQTTKIGGYEVTCWFVEKAEAHNGN